MNTLHQEDLSDMSDLHDSRRDREISLGTSTILLIFFAIALVCSGFFGFGYSLGRKSAQPVAATTTEATSSSASDAFRLFKTSPKTPAGQAVTTPATSDSTDSVSTAAKAAQPAPAPFKVAAASKPAAFDPDASVVGDRPVAAPAVKVTPDVRKANAQAAVAAAGAPAATAGSIVQVSAFRRQEDADMVASALRKKGYTVFVRTEPQDSYLHVQLGPYASKKDAEAMKDRLSADGFNALVK